MRHFAHVDFNHGELAKNLTYMCLSYGNADQINGISIQY